MAYNRQYEITVADYRLNFRNFMVGTGFKDAGGRRITADLKSTDLAQIPVTATVLRPPLQMEFEVDGNGSGGSSGAGSSALKLYNLNSKTKKTFQRKGAYVKVRAGYEDTGLKVLFVGQVLKSYTERKGEDLVTTVLLTEAGQAYGLLRVNKKYPQNTPFFSILNDLVKLAGQCGIEKGFIQEPEYNARASAVNFVADSTADSNGEAKKVNSSYIAEGFWREVMDEVCDILSMTWYIVQGKIHVVVGKRGRGTRIASGYGVKVKDSDVRESIETISDDTAKNAKENEVSGIKFTVALSPTISVAHYVDMDVEDYKGVYKVTKVSHRLDYRGSLWETTVEAMRVGNRS